MKPFSMNVFDVFGHYAGKIRTLRNEIRTEHLLQSLPDHVRKDIGWTDRHDAPRVRCR